MIKNIMIVMAIIMFSMVSIASAGTAFVDLTNWTALGNGNWTVSNDGSYVTQSENEDPTYFISDTNYINTELKGKLGVQGTLDDDFIGFVFGYNGPDDYLLFDWRQWDDGSLYKGFRLSRISGNVNEDGLWYHTGNGIEVLDSLTGNSAGGWGWGDDVEHDFTLTYSLDRIIIDIDGINIFDIAGTYSDGKFGFYNYSQPNAIYGNLTAPGSPVPIPPTLLLFGSGFIGLVGMYRRKKIL